MNMLVRKALSAKGKIMRLIGHVFAEINNKPLFVIGNQKSGTSVVAALLAEYSGISVTIDLMKEMRSPAFHRVKLGELGIEDFIYRNKLDFSRGIIKEPNLTTYYKELAEFYSQSKFLFVIRDPRDNIRSILNRLHLDGQGNHLSSSQSREISKAWQLVLFSKWMGISTDNYILSLAERWNCLADIYLENRNHIVLMRYEDFLVDKVRVIEQVANELDLDKKKNIADMVDVQFQPKGTRTLDYQSFFGMDNLKLIERTCVMRMDQFGYSLSLPLE